MKTLLIRLVLAACFASAVPAAQENLVFTDGRSTMAITGALRDHLEKLIQRLEAGDYDGTERRQMLPPHGVFKHAGKRYRWAGALLYTASPGDRLYVLSDKLYERSAFIITNGFDKWAVKKRALSNWWPGGKRS